MDRLSAESLRWTLGPYCAFVGAFMLVAPHRFTSPVYSVLAPYRGIWGMAALAAGVALLSVAILRPRRAVALLGHGLAGVTLLALSASFLQSRAWTGMIAYGVLGVGTLVAGTLPLRASHAGRDLFALLMGVIAVLQGLLLAVLRPSPWVIGPALLLGGGLILAAHLRRSASAFYLWTSHLAAGAAFFLFGLVFSLPIRAWTGLVLYWGCGLILALLPWLSRRLAALDPASLRTRLAFSLATATSVALVLTAAIATSQEERLATSQVMETQQVEARAIARNVADYVQLNGARTAVVATLAARLPMTPVFQRALLEASRPSYPDVTGFVVLDAAGTVLAAIGGVPLDISDWRGLSAEIAAELQRQERTGIPIRLAGAQRPLILLSVPILLEDGRMAGVLVSAFDSELLARRIVRPGSNVYLADGFGRLIASRQDADELASLPAGWDREVRSGRVPPVARRIAAFDRVPGGIDWVVAVERPRAAALAGVRRGRDMAFALLLVVVPLAVIGGIIVASLIARPLGALAQAVEEMTAGSLSVPATVPLEPSDITEVASLAAAFQEMRGRLAVRTRESERLAEELRARADALAETDRRKDEFLAMLAHELRNPLGAIANAAHVMDRIGASQPSPPPPVQRAVGVIQRQIQHLVRLVDDLLDVSRITRGKIELRLEPMDLRDTVRGAVEMTRPLVETKEHALRVELPPGPLPVHADPTRLEQVLGNLVRNAAKYTEPGGKIEVSAWSEDGEAVARVRDNGIGIPPELLPRVFDLFIQGEQSLDRSGGGLGIGLTLVRRLVEMHGGRVEAQSEGEGQGSEFTVRLPLSPG